MKRSHCEQVIAYNAHHLECNEVEVNTWSPGTFFRLRQLYHHLLGLCKLVYSAGNVNFMAHGLQVWAIRYKFMFQEDLDSSTLFNKVS